jgi:hypothetical protein
MSGIKETKDVLKFAISLGEAIDLSLADGKFGIEDLGNMIAPMVSAGEAFAGIDQVKAELSDLDQAERDELVQYAKDELQLSNEGLEQKIEAALKMAADIHKFVLMFKKVEA